MLWDKPAKCNEQLNTSTEAVVNRTATHSLQGITSRILYIITTQSLSVCLRVKVEYTAFFYSVKSDILRAVFTLITSLSTPYLQQQPVLVI